MMTVLINFLILIDNLKSILPYVLKAYPPMCYVDLINIWNVFNIRYENIYL